MADQDPLDSFIGNMAEKIKLAKEHKDIMQAVQASANTGIVENQQDPFANLMQKIGDTIVSKLPPKEQPVAVETTINEQQIAPDASVVLANKIKQALEQAKMQQQSVEIAETESIEPATEPQAVATDAMASVEQEQSEEPADTDINTKALAQKIRDAIENAKNKALNKVADVPSEQNEEPTAKEPEEPADRQIASYIDELEKIKDTGSIKQKEEANTTLKELKVYIDKTVQDYSRRILDLGGGGGSVAVQYANGGTMNGDLNVSSVYPNNANGSLGSPSNRWDKIYANQVDSLSSNIVIELSGFYVDGDFTVNGTISAIGGNSNQWNDVYSTVQANSASWDESPNISDIAAASASWNSNYTTTNLNSASWSSAYNSYNSISGRYTTLDYLSSNIIYLSSVYIGPNPNNFSTTTPAARLTVFGNISASGTLSANSINSNAYVANTGFVIADTGTSRVFTNTDNGKCITFSNTTPITASLPAGLPVGFNVMLIQINTGQVYLSAGAGVTINSDGGKRNIASQHSAASLISYAANTFNLAGNLST